MKKERIERFIKKYSLSGQIEKVVWTVKDNKLFTRFVSGDKNVIGSVGLKDFKLDNVEFGIYTTSQLVKMLSVLGDDIDIDVFSIEERPIHLKITDKETSMNFVVAESDIIPRVPALTSMPNWDVNIKLSQDVVSKYIKAQSALADVTTFTVLTEGALCKVVLGYSNVNSNRISMTVDANFVGQIQPISFHALYFKEILNANKECDTAVLDVSASGIAHITFSVEDYKASYYLPEMRTGI